MNKLLLLLLSTTLALPLPNQSAVRVPQCSGTDCEVQPSYIPVFPTAGSSLYPSKSHSNSPAAKEEDCDENGNPIIKPPSRPYKSATIPKDKDSKISPAATEDECDENGNPIGKTQTPNRYKSSTIPKGSSTSPTTEEECDENGNPIIKPPSGPYTSSTIPKDSSTSPTAKGYGNPSSGQKPGSYISANHPKKYSETSPAAKEDCDENGNPIGYPGNRPRPYGLSHPKDSETSPVSGGGDYPRKNSGYGSTLYDGTPQDKIERDKELIRKINSYKERLVPQHETKNAGSDDRKSRDRYEHESYGYDGYSPSEHETKNAGGRKKTYKDQDDEPNSDDFYKSSENDGSYSPKTYESNVVAEHETKNAGGTDYRGKMKHGKSHPDSPDSIDSDDYPRRSYDDEDEDRPYHKRHYRRKRKCSSRYRHHRGRQYRNHHDEEDLNDQSEDYAPKNQRPVRKSEVKPADSLFPSPDSY